MSERLFKASEYREAEAEHKRQHPTKGDYWWEDHFCPVLVVLAVAADFITVCCKTKPSGEDHWTWDLNQLQLMRRDEFVKRLECGHVGGSHFWAVKVFERGTCDQSEQYDKEPVTDE